MLKLSNIKVPAATGSGELPAFVAKLLGIPRKDIKSLTILKRSVDARHKNDVCFVYSVVITADNEAEIIAAKGAAVSLYVPPETYQFPYAELKAELNTDFSFVVVGAGPAGLFAALCLAEAGIPCILLERGRPVEDRTLDVEQFWNTGKLSERSNVQFGEGGAGTFSDGKLTTGIDDKRIAFVLRKLAEFGAPEDILYLAKPHIGTDKLRAVVISMRQALLKLGCDIRFGHKLDGLQLEGGILKGIDVTSDEGSYHLQTRHLILAPGNSARDTFEMLERSGVQLSSKNFSVGVRIEHLQKNIDMTQYGKASTLGTLPSSDYKLAVHLKNGRSVYTFCVCPGGRVIASSSEAGQVVINGMSEYARDGKNINGGLLVSVTPDDFDTASPLSGVHFQRELEKAAFFHGGGDYSAPAQLVGDFLAKRPSKKQATVTPTYLPKVRWGNLWDVLPAFVCESIAEALPKMESSVHGFSNQDAVLTAVETRSSSPVRIDRTDYQAAGIQGLYPCGEGSGYAGGIMSAAVDGIRAAEALCASLL
jgi:uncharacterized protein